MKFSVFHIVNEEKKLLVHEEAFEEAYEFAKEQAVLIVEGMIVVEDKGIRVLEFDAGWKEV